MKRFGMFVKLKKDKIKEYKKLHSAVWPEVLDKLKQCNFRNYSIYNKDRNLFAYFEYTGSDYNADIEKLLSDPICAKWEKMCDECFEPGKTVGKSKELWVEMEEIFHLD